MDELGNPMALDPADILLRLALAALLGTAVGFERELHGQLAGMRTHALVSTGAALFTLVGAYGFRNGFGHASIGHTRVAAQIVSGIGFIGAGAILRDQGSSAASPPPPPSGRQQRWGWRPAPARSRSPSAASW
jgi:uncharacterized membrane protein YhiD involved in acid resistance